MRGLSAVVVLAGLSAWAQQSVFNVPSGLHTERLLLQEQLNLGTTGESSFIAMVGLPLGFEVGVDVAHLDFSGRPTGTTSRSLLMADVVWTHEVSPWLTVQGGGLFGAGQAPSGPTLVSFGWAVARAEWRSARLSAVLGSYVGTTSYLGEGWPAGPMAALEWAALPDRLVLQADWLFGNHESAVAVVGATVLLPEGWQLSAGVIFPSPMSHNELGLCVELTAAPSFDARPAVAPSELTEGLASL